MHPGVDTDGGVIKKAGAFPRIRKTVEVSPAAEPSHEGGAQKALEV
jgi:hypothetical protein